MVERRDATTRVTLKGAVIAEIVAGNPDGRLKAVEYGPYGELRRIEWHDPQACDGARSRLLRVEGCR